MRRLLLPACALVAAGCNDYSLLESSFCSSAMASSASTMAGLCDDFENPTIDTGTWTVLQTDGGMASTVEPKVVHLNSSGRHNTDGSPKVAYRGKQTALFTAAGGGSARISEGQVTPTLYSQHEYALRFFTWVDQLVPGHVALVTLLDGAGKPRFELGLQDGVYTLTDEASGKSIQAGSQASFLTWSCVELDVTQATSTAPASVQLSLEGDTALVLLGVTPTPDMATTVVGPSIDASDMGGTMNVWVDELILAHRFIGCTE